MAHPRRRQALHGCLISSVVLPRASGTARAARARAQDIGGRATERNRRGARRGARALVRTAAADGDGAAAARVVQQGRMPLLALGPLRVRTWVGSGLGLGLGLGFGAGSGIGAGVGVRVRGQG